jgi:hypothetical protein
MLIDIQAPPSDENISITQSDHEILIVFTIISPFSSYLREVLQAVTETLPSRENNFIRKTESNLLIVVVCLHFPHLSHRFRVIRVKTHRQQQRRPLPEKTFSMNSPTPTSYWRSVDIFRLSLTVFELFACIRFSS